MTFGSTNELGKQTRETILHRSIARHNSTTNSMNSVLFSSARSGTAYNLSRDTREI